MSTFYERTLQATHLEQLRRSAGSFKSLCDLIAGVMIAFTALSAVIGVLGGHPWVLLIALPAVLPYILIIYFGRMMYSLSMVNEAIFEMSLEVKREQQIIQDPVTKKDQDDA